MINPDSISPKKISLALAKSSVNSFYIIYEGK